MCPSVPMTKSSSTRMEFSFFAMLRVLLFVAFLWSPVLCQYNFKTWRNEYKQNLTDRWMPKPTKQANLMRLWTLLLREGGEPDRAKHSHLLITDIESLEQYLTPANFTTLVRIPNGLYFEDDIWANSWDLPMYLQRATSSERTEVVQQFFKQLELPSDVKLVMAAGLKLHQIPIAYAAHKWHKTLRGWTKRAKREGFHGLVEALQDVNQVLATAVETEACCPSLSGPDRSITRQYMVIMANLFATLYNHIYIDELRFIKRHRWDDIMALSLGVRGTIDRKLRQSSVTIRAGTAEPWETDETLKRLDEETAKYMRHWKERIVQMHTKARPLSS